ncbi:ground-like domain protein [Oesophagostomum dentatum]|uniref:Ground-like domain protein n=1 Tax=Oesophagostomum dentatum TaxID=61180 RepID=A0A0B1TUY2_OESDE|nr:ground-like domain protein [Oesophagostomum dentatum]
MPMYPTYSYRPTYPTYGTYPAAPEPTIVTGGGCGGGAAVAPAPLPRPPAQNDCCCGCTAPCKYKRRAAAYGSKTVDPLCNNETLRELIQEYITDDATTSKRAIQQAAEEKLEGTTNVICGHGEFSYIVHTDTFCQSTKDDITCYVFQPL